MEKMLAEKLQSWKFDHVGIVVEDLDKAIEYYQLLGLGPFVANPSGGVTDRKVYGKPVNNIRLRGAEVQMGSVKVEMIQPVEGESVQKEFLMSKGEGLSHIGFIVDDIDKEVANLEDKGCQVISSGRFPPNGAFAYITSKVGGLVIELISKK